MCITPLIIMAAVCYVLYVASWIACYNGMVNVIVILGLTIPPCFVFLFFAIDRKNKMIRLRLYNIMIQFKIQIYGVGVIGCLYAVLFGKAGYDTTVYA